MPFDQARSVVAVRTDQSLDKTRKGKNVKKTIVATIAMLALAAHAGENTQARADVLEGQSFKCASFVKAVVVLSNPDNTAVQCDVLSDVRGNGSSAVVIPKKSRFFGWKKGARVEWTSWTSPDGTVVGDAVLHGAAFASNIDRKADVFNVIALRDIVVQRADSN
ncbi:hypothetical protein [Paraburkholderia sp. SIMBA_054]|uniref:hypothetical protein n=1 Tax=Paraburkholderia sp. SIMBA_054 TaxID=3085795 RepID=UPI00397C2C26